LRVTLSTDRRASCALRHNGETAHDKRGKTANMTAEQMTVEQWLAIRKEAALQIDAETAEVICSWGDIGDPYGVNPKSPSQHFIKDYRVFGA